MADPEQRMAQLLLALGGQRRTVGGDGPADDVPSGRHRDRLDPPDTARPGPVRWLTLPGGLRSARVRVTPAAVRGLLLVLVVIAVVLGVRVVWAEQRAAPEPIPVLTPTSAPASATAPTQPEQTEQTEQTEQPGPVPSASATSPPDVLVHVIGAVAVPGVVHVPSGSRVQDAVARAGGALGEADLTRINLARPVLDGERVWVPVEGQDPPEDVGRSAPVTPSDAVAQRAQPGSTQGPPVDLNTADAAILDTLPGVGPVTAEAILRWRGEHGRFSTVEELLEVQGIGERTLEELRAHVSVS